MSAAFKKVTDAIAKAELPSYLVPKGFEPKVLVNIEYPNGQTVDLGNTLAVDATQQQPQLKFAEGVDSSKSYAIIFADPDAKSRQEPIWSPYLHWACTVSSNGSPRQDLFKHMGPAPPSGTGPHRYITLLYETASSELKSDVEVKDDNRPKFPVEELVKQNGLTLVGVNFFHAEKPKKE